jgi:hypothetical protein
MYYCGPDCQKKDWNPMHKNECKSFESIRCNKDLISYLDQDFVRLFIRILIKVMVNIQLILKFK